MGQKSWWGKPWRALRTQSLAKRLQEANHLVVATIYPQYRHLMILFVLASPFQDGEPVMEDIVRFIRAHQ